MFTNAIARRPAASLVRGITSHPELGRPDYGRALEQHAAYVEALEAAGLAVRVLPAEEGFPDSCFIEDNAVCVPLGAGPSAFAVACRPGAPTRLGEVAGIVDLLHTYYDDVDAIAAPGSLEGGDVMMVGDTYYVGLSARTNPAGVAQFSEALSLHGLRCVAVPMPETLHLKTGLSWLGKGGNPAAAGASGLAGAASKAGDVLLVAPEFLHEPLFADFRKILVDPAESYAANSIRVNDLVLVPAGFPKAARAIREAGQEGGFGVLEVDTSEFRKLDGGLSCLSLRF